MAKAKNARQADELVATRVRADVAEARLQDQAERLDRAQAEAEELRALVNNERDEHRKTIERHRIAAAKDIGNMAGKMDSAERRAIQAE